VLALAVLALAAPLAAELAPAPDGTFSVVVIPDTQWYRGAGTKAEPDSKDDVTNAVFEAYTAWIAGNLDRQNVAFVTHVGDIVDRNVEAQWAVARRCMDKLHGKVPYGIAPGNHDMARDGNSSLYQSTFPASRFAGFGWYGGAYGGHPGQPGISGNNANSYQLFSAGGLDFLFLHLECNAPDDVLAWADGVMEGHPDRLALVTTHMGLGPLEKPVESRGYYDDPKGRMRWTKRHGNRGNSPQEMWEKCLRKHGNLVAVFSGDQSRTQSMYRLDRGKHSNPVHQLMSDYGNKGLRVYRFDPASDRVRVITYNPIQGELCGATRIVPNHSDHQFAIEHDFAR